MTRYLLLSITLLLASNAISQNTNLSDYSYVVVPEQFDFLKGRDQFQINSMTQFYLEKNGFNAYLADSAPNANRCDGLYASVEQLSTIFGTKLQVVLKDCNENEVYRGQEGKSKYKEFDKSYQDALRKSFVSLKNLHIKQKDVVLLTNNTNNSIVSKETKPNTEMVELTKPKVSRVSGNLLPDAKFSNYSNSGKTYLLRKTAEGYSLYEESANAADGLLLKGKIIVMDKVIKYMDTAGNVADAIFDASGNLIIKENGASTVYMSED
ncbi:hypothetical protein [Aequorivita antarctica]|uniref:WG repeat-containing protein n=1 Tax=Aequorivita antarctica TaxID=153266 RepID=A0A5C6Z0L5_9FLAO|nr:hypothetical protein [Aequorivita antarctica]TXD72977.1 hypothetical protein ESU54_10005 [Aequorivita antarctica]SRX74616.1 hypothetical protein AEQU3_01595 [Aequorivita antarctica]